MVSFEKAYNNIFKDNDWVNTFLGYVLILVISCIPSLIFQITHPSQQVAQNIKPVELLSLMTQSSFSSAFSIIGSLFLSGFVVVYLRNLIADSNSPLPSIKTFWKEIFVAGIKQFGAVMLYYFAFIFIALIIAGVVTVLFLSKITFFVIIAAIITIVSISAAVILASMYYPLLTINFAARNLEFPALFDFKAATKFLCKDFWKALLIMCLVGICMCIITIVAILIFTLVGFKTLGLPAIISLIYCLVLLPLSAISTFIYVNLLSQVYYSSIEKI